MSDEQKQLPPDAELFGALPERREPSPEVRKAILSAHREQWVAVLDNAIEKFRTANDIGDEPLKDSARHEAFKARKAIESVDKRLAELKEANSAG